MLKLSTTLMLCALAFFAKGQTVNFFAADSRWVYNNYETWEPGQPFLHASEEQNIIHGDTLIDGLTYYKLYSTFFNTTTVYQPSPIPPQYTYSYDSVGPTFLRYDAMLKRVYHLPSVGATERLIYDFNLQVGDPLPMQAEVPLIAVVASIDTLTVFGVPVKRFFIDIGQNLTNPDNFILEGMGGSNGLLHFQPEFLAVSGGFNMTHFNCFQFADSIFSPDHSDCPFLNFVSGLKQPGEEPEIAISPNPAQDFFSISIGEEWLNSDFTLVDCLGRVVQTITLTTLTTTGRLQTPGVYFWQVSQRGKLIKTGKLVQE